MKDKGSQILIETKKNYCYQCKEEIINIEELSIEHKKPWLNVNSELFWDLDNIAFSHLACNIKVAKKINKIKYPPGRKWCWRCQRFRLLEEFSECAKKDRKRECKEYYTKYRKEYRKRQLS